MHKQTKHWTLQNTTNASTDTVAE